jgi:hypothetical protein
MGIQFYKPTLASETKACYRIGPTLINMRPKSSLCPRLAGNRPIIAMSHAVISESDQPIRNLGALPVQLLLVSCCYHVPRPNLHNMQSTGILLQVSVNIFLFLMHATCHYNNTGTWWKYKLSKSSFRCQTSAKDRGSFWHFVTCYFLR